METDSFFCQLLKQLPETLFQLIGLPAERASSYRFDSVEVKKSFRIDGLYVPKEAGLPLYFVEVQFQRLETFYANLFAKVFLFLEENDPGQEWIAVAIFPKKSVEQKQLGPYDDLLRSRRVKRIYLDQLSIPEDPPPGLAILKLVTAPLEEASKLVSHLMHKARVELADSDLGPKVVQLVEELLIRRFAQLIREEVRTMFQLQDIRKTKVWQEAREEAREETELRMKRDFVKKLLAKEVSKKEIAEMLEISIEEVRRLAKRSV